MKFAGGYGRSGEEVLRIEFDVGTMTREEVEEAVAGFLREKLGNDRAKGFILKDQNDPGFVYVEHVSGEDRNPEKNS